MSLALIWIGAAASGPPAGDNPAAGAEERPVNILDGKTFAGQVGTVGESGTGTDDLFVFEDGMFVSQECQRRCGYTEGPYFVRFVEDGVQIKATLPCVDADATMVWTGTVRGDTIEGTIAWTSERWYWTIERDLWFKGKLVEREQANRSEADAN